MSSLMSILGGAGAPGGPGGMGDPGPGGPSDLPPPPGMGPGPVPGMPMVGGDQGGPPVPPELQSIMDALGISASDPQAEQEPDDVAMSPIEHIQAAMMHLMMAFAQEGDHGKGQGVLKGMGALQGILAGEQKGQAAQAPPPALGG